MIIIKINTDNDAFQDGNYYNEIARILKIISDDFYCANVKYRYKDVNGNRVAKCEIIED